MGILKALSNCKRKAPLAIRRLANLAYYNPDVHHLHPSVKVITIDSCSFYVADGIESVQAVKGNPIFRNVRPDDVCLDIGAGIGAFAVPLAKMTQKVYAVEPLYWRELKANMELNKLNYIPLPIGLSEDDGRQEIQYGNKKQIVNTYSWASLRSMIQAKKIDFLKLDCEGAEWAIPEDSLLEFREIRAELHIRRGHEQEDHPHFLYWNAWLKKHNYSGTCEQVLKDTYFDPNFRECYYINYSKIES